MRKIFNRELEGGVWQYADNKETEFLFFNQSRVSIEFIDDFIEGRQGLDLPEESVLVLRGLRHDAFQAFKDKNVPLMESRLKSLEYACRICGMTESAIKGAQFESGRRKGAKGHFRLLVEKAAKSSPSQAWKSVISTMENMEGVQEVDWDSEKIWLLGEDKARTFKTVRNILPVA